MRKVMLFAVLGVIAAFTGSLLAESDIFSVNFYHYGSSGSLTDSQKARLRVEGDEAAGVGDWNKTGWENFLAGTGTHVITGSGESTATFNVIRTRNASPFYWTLPRTTLIDNANADLMDSGFSATEDSDKKFEMTVSDIPLDNYDVIFYFRINNAQYSHGTGNIVFNGGPAKSFSFPENDEFSAFDEIAGADSTGNYILLEGVTGSSFTFQMWGDGFCHMGPAGFQFGVTTPKLYPQPSDGMAVSYLTTNKLLWTLPDPKGTGPVTCDVYFGTDPGMSVSDPDIINNPQVVFDDDTKNGFYDIALVSNEEYYWQVVVYDSGAAIAQPVFTFNTFNTAPTVNAGNNRSVWMTAGSVQVDLSGLVDDDGIPLPYSVLWEVIDEPLEGAATIDPAGADTENIQVTFSEVGQYVLQLTAHDGELADSNTVTVTVNADLDPQPADGSTVSSLITDRISWTLPQPSDGGVVRCDVFFGTNSNVSFNPQIVFNDTTKNGSRLVTLVSNQQYYWQVFVYDSGIEGGTEPIAEPIFTFDTNNTTPIVNAGEDTITWITTDGTAYADLHGSVIDDGYPQPYSVLWEVAGKPAGSIVTIDPVAANTENIQVTFSDAGEYVLRLTANDSETSDFDTVKVSVDSNACKAYGNLCLQFLQADLNRSGKVDLADLYLYAIQWMNPPGCIGYPDDCADVIGNDGVNLQDFSPLAARWQKSKIPLVISEFMASSSSKSDDAQWLLDEDGESSDWIEIYNPTNMSVNLAQWSLTDKTGNLTKWQFPDFTLNAGAYLIVFASAKDRTDPTGQLHTNFSLSAGGEYLGLVMPDGQIVVSEFASKYPKQVNNISYGLASEGNTGGLNYRYFDNPTPGQESVGAGFAGISGDTKFSVDRGFYQDEFDVAVTCLTVGANIRYTVDCSEPTLTNGIDYVPFVPIDINGTTCLRARSFKTDWLASNVDTQTYIFLADVMNQPTNPPGFPDRWDNKAADYDMDPAVISRYTEEEIKSSLLSIPSVSLVTDMDNLFDSSIGIYIHPTEEGVEWERPVSAEWIDHSGGRQFQINCGLRMQGNAARWYAIKKPFRLLFKAIYGSSKLEFPMFAESGNAAESFDTITLRANSQNDLGYGGKTQITDENGRRTLLDMGTPQSHGRFVHLYVNGLYWGVYNAVERPQASFCVNYFGGTKVEWDANNGNTAIDGTRDTFNEMIAQIHTVPFDNPAYQKIQGNNLDGTPNPSFPVYLDMPNYIDYMLSNFYIGTGDWANGASGTRNYYCGRRRTENDDPGFKWFIWDAEMSLGGGNKTGNSDGPAEPYSILKNNEQFKLLFADHVHRHMFNGGALTPEASLERFNVIVEDNRQAIIAEEARWDITTVDTWESIISTIINSFFPSRTNTVIGYFKNIGLYPNVDAPSFTQHGGAVESGFDLEMTAPAGMIYYTLDGSDPHIWPDTDPGPSTSVMLVTEADAKSVLVPTGDIGTNWQGGNEPYTESGWDDGTPITPGKTGGVGYDENPTYDPYITYDVIGEMNDNNTSCYIRIPFNVSAQDLADFNFMTLSMRYDDGFIAYLNGTLVASANSTTDDPPQWDSNSNGGQSDTLAMKFENFNIDQHIDELNVGDNILAIHGLNTGKTSSDFLISVELIAGHNPSGGGGEVSPSAMEYTGPVPLNLSSTVKARVVSGGIWSALNEAIFAVGPVAENLRITEIMYHPTDPTQAEKDAVGDPNLTDEDFEFIELKNISTVDDINLNLVSFTDGIDFTFGDYTLNYGEFAVIVKNQAAFMARYPGVSPSLIAGTYTGALSNSGEEIVIRDANDTEIHDFDFNDGWFVITDGGGYSLNKLDPDTASTSAPDLWDSQSGWRPSSVLNGTPGADDTGYTLQPDDIVISEVMTHTDDTVYGDWIEIWNRTESPVYIGGWFLSDNKKNLMKYEIAASDSRATIRPNSYVVFDSVNDFRNAGDPGSHVQFGLSEYGEDVYLTSGAGTDEYYTTDQEDFGAAENGTTLGMYIKSDQSDDFVRLQTATKGTANNNDPIIGPVVISEIMYNPADPDSEAEFIELTNITSSEVKLYDPAYPANTWQIKGVSFTFPQGLKIAANKTILVTRGDPVQFRSTYGIGAGIDIYRYGGKLNNGGEEVTLVQPGAPDPITAKVPEIRIDRVEYNNSWYPATDGQGKSLTRSVLGDYGNDSANWQGATPSPGS